MSFECFRVQSARLGPNREQLYLWQNNVHVVESEAISGLKNIVAYNTQVVYTPPSHRKPPTQSAIVGIRSSCRTCKLSCATIRA
jgi:hypothetical protein